MRIESLHLSEFKGLDTELPWASVLVLFGPNDAGKTNVIEALIAAFGDSEATRLDPHDYGRDVGEYELVVELDGRHLEGHPDQEVLASWFGRMIEASGEAPKLKEAVAKLKTIRGSERAAAVVAFLDAIDHRLREDQDAGELASGDDPVASRWFAVTSSTVTWLKPRPVGASDSASWEEFFEVAEFDEAVPPLVEVVQISSTETALAELHSRVERFIEADLDFREYETTREGESMLRADYVDRYVFQSFERDPLLDRDGDRVFIRQTVREACEELTCRINDLAPGFLARAYEIRIQPNEPDDWRRVERRISIRLRPRASQHIHDFELDVTSSGMSAWAAYTISEALRIGEEAHRQRRHSWGPSRVPPSVTLFVFDEPERHLHPLAQVEAAAWVAERATAGAHVVLATHAVPFLDLPLESVEYLKLTRSPDWKTAIERITPDVLKAVEESGHALGLPPAAVIQLTKAWLVVEGEHDRAIVDAFYGRELRQRGIQILALRGAARAKASFLNMDALGRLGYPFFVLLDNARAEQIKQGTLPTTTPRSEEERIVEQLVRLKEAGVADAEPFGLPYPDILCALPEQAVIEYAQEAGSGTGFTTWDDLCQRYANQPDPPQFKAYVMETLGLRGGDPGDLVEGALRRAGGVPRQGDPLGRNIAQILARVG